MELGFGLGLSYVRYRGTPTPTPTPSVPVLALAVAGDSYPPQFSATFPGGLYEGDAIQYQHADTYAGLAGASIQENLIDSSEGTAGEVDLGLGSISSPAETFMRVRLKDGETGNYGAWSNIVKHGDVTAPSITSSASPSADELQNVLCTITTDELCTIELSGSDAALIDVADASTPATSFVVTLNTGNLDYEDKASYSFSATATDLTGLTDTQAITVTVNNVDDTAPTITSADPSGSYNEGVAIGGTLAADETVTWSVTGEDAALVTLNPTTGVWSLAATDYETKTSYSFTFVATDEASNTSSQAVALTITNVLEAATLVALALSSATATQNELTTINVQNAATGSALAVVTGTLPTGMTLDSAARTISGTPTTLETASFTLRETLADSPNSPNDTALSITVGALGAGSLDPAITPPVLSLAVGATTYPPQFDVEFDDTVVVGDTLKIAWANPGQLVDAEGFFTSTVGESSNQIDSGEAAANALDMALSGIASGTYDYQCWIMQAGGDYSAPSNTVQHGPDIVAPVLSAPVDTATGTSTATISVDTDTAEGTLYYVVTTSATPPSKAQVKAGQDNSGAAGAKAGSSVIGAAGTASWNLTGLTGATQYYTYFMHEDVAGNQSEVAAADGFLTDPAASFSMSETAAPSHVNVGFADTAYTFAALAMGAADSSRIMVAYVQCYDGGFYPSAVTIGGVAATKIAAADTPWSSVWYAAVPTGTSGDVVVTMTGNISYIGLRLWRVVGSSGPGTVAVLPYNWNASPQELSVTTPEGGGTMLFGYFETTSGSVSWSNATGVSETDNYLFTLASAIRSTSGAATVSVSGFGSLNSTLIGVNFAP